MVEEAVPTPKRSPLRRIVSFLVLSALAFAGGIAATIGYDRMVRSPADGLPPPPKEEPPRPELPLPPAEEPPDVRIDPLAQAIAAIRPDLPPSALLEVQIRRDGPVVFLSGRADSRRTIARAADAVAIVGGVEAVDVRSMALVNREYVVMAGDNPSKIAMKLYGPAAHWRALVPDNPALEKGILVPGQKLVVPPLDR